MLAGQNGQKIQGINSSLDISSIRLMTCNTNMLAGRCRKYNLQRQVLPLIQFDIWQNEELNSVSKDLSNAVLLTEGVLKP